MRVPLLPAGVCRAQITRQLPSIQRALIRFEGIYRAVRLNTACLWDDIISITSVRSWPPPPPAPCARPRGAQTKQPRSPAAVPRLTGPCASQRLPAFDWSSASLRPAPSHPSPLLPSPLLPSARSIHPAVFTIGDRALDYKPPPVCADDLRVRNWIRSQTS